MLHHFHAVNGDVQRWVVYVFSVRIVKRREQLLPVTYLDKHATGEGQSR